MMKLTVFLKRLIEILIISLIVNSCNYWGENNDQLISFKLTILTKTRVVNLSDIGFFDIEYIPLETHENSVISGIDYLFFNDYNINKIIVEDSSYIIKNGNSVLRFYYDGSFVTKIGSVGRGPDEFTQVGDIDYDKIDKEICILSGWQKKLCYYSESGEHIRTTSIPFYCFEFRFIEGRVLCYCGNNSGKNLNSYVLIGKDGQIINEFPNKYFFDQKSGYGFAHENLFYRFNNGLFIKEVYSDTIYSFENMQFNPHVVIQAGDKLITPKARSEYDMQTICASYIQPLNLLEFGDYVYYAFIYKYVLPDDVLIYGFIGSKKNDLRVLFNLGQGITNDLDGGPGIIPLTIKDDNTIISMVDALTLKNHIASEEFKNSTPKYPEKKKELGKLANSLKETDNPVLVLVRLRE